MASQSRADPQSGGVDASFGVNGTTFLIKVGGSISNAREAIADDNSRILLAGTFKTNSGEQYALFRLTADGEQDATFGVQGVVVGKFVENKDARANSVTITEDNKILLSGASGAKTASGASVEAFMGGIARFDQNGSLDPSFGSEGHISLSVRPPSGGSPSSVEGAYDVNSDIATAVLSSVAKNKIVYTWSANTRAIWGQLVFSYSVLGRLAADGISDNSFQKGGYVYVRLPEENVRITSVKRHLVVEGHVVVAGHVIAAGPDRGFLRRYDLNGNVDTTFGDSTLSDGFVFALPVSDSRPITTTTLIRHESTLLLVGNSEGQGVMAAFTLNGHIDRTFNNGELLSANLPDSGGKVTWVDAASSDGGILALGHIGGPEAGQFVLARYLASGVLDARFGAGKGWVSSTPGIELKALAVQRRSGGLPNRILVTGVVTDGEYAVVMAFKDV